MISKAKCVGIKYGVSKKNGEKNYSTLLFDVTDFCDDDNSKYAGRIYSSLFKWGTFARECVGKELLVSVDDFGNVKDIEY